VVDEAAGRGDDHIDAALQGERLRPVADAAEHGDHRKAGMAAVGLEAVGDLGGELTRRRQHEAARAATWRRPLLGGEPLQDRQREGGRLAGAGLGDAEQVAALQQRRDGLRLDRRRLGVALGGERLQQLVVEPEVVESRGQRIVLSAASPDAPCRTHVGLSWRMPAAHEGRKRGIDAGVVA
jgi:hypothetical protein